MNTKFYEFCGAMVGFVMVMAIQQAMDKQYDVPKQLKGKKIVTIPRWKYRKVEA